ncbi:hypothetical protein L1785_12095 [Antribacter sp. KLBMP9083]|uniref:Uncharacterized protein n=1 Tax=Antribacter soli TaxID=2910976 RepID=A0AA41UC41_9MICO|nr:multiple cyclophane-containing RiPP AmcA [Antribacter soli]MCF4121724.1 hypothetical protein [Antribacter soli]
MTLILDTANNALAVLIDSDHDAVTALTGTGRPTAEWDNRPSWDNWKKDPGPWDNRPSWDNWKKNS